MQIRDASAVYYWLWKIERRLIIAASEEHFRLLVNGHFEDGWQPEGDARCFYSPDGSSQSWSIILKRRRFRFRTTA